MGSLIDAIAVFVSAFGGAWFAHRLTRRSDQDDAQLQALVEMKTIISSDPNRSGRDVLASNRIVFDRALVLSLLAQSAAIRAAMVTLRDARSDRNRILREENMPAPGDLGSAAWQRTYEAAETAVKAIDAEIERRLETAISPRWQFWKRQ